MTSNTVMGVPEREFAAAWCSLLWRAMLKTGKGYRKGVTNRHSGKGEDRRSDKLPREVRLKNDERIERVIQEDLRRAQWQAHDEAQKLTPAMIEALNAYRAKAEGSQ